MVLVHCQYFMQNGKTASNKFFTSNITNWLRGMIVEFGPITVLSIEAAE